MAQDKEFHALLHSNKDHLLHTVRKALAEAGLDQYDLDSIKLYLRRGPRRCPDGKDPVWEPVRKPDGTVVYEWVCK
jgi:hypothetical protein